MKPETKLKFIPLIMTIIVLAVDQVSKILVTLFLSNDQSVAVLGDFFRLTLRREKIGFRRPRRIPETRRSGSCPRTARGS